MVSDEVIQTLRNLERRGNRLHNKAIELVINHYKQLNFTELEQLLQVIAVIDDRTTRLGMLQSLLDKFDDLVAVLGEPPKGTHELLVSATRLGMESVTELLNAQGEPLYFNLPTDREQAYVAASSARLDSYWGPHLTQFSLVVQQTLDTGLRRGQTYQQMAAGLRAATGISRQRALLIVRNEISSAHAVAMEEDQRSLGLTHYIWSTARDSRVRPEHQKREWKTFAWDDPPADGPPGAAILCRCVAIPVRSVGPVE